MNPFRSKKDPQVRPSALAEQNRHLIERLKHLLDERTQTFELIRVLFEREQSFRKYDNMDIWDKQGLSNAKIIAEEEPEFVFNKMDYLIVEKLLIILQQEKKEEERLKRLAEDMEKAKKYMNSPLEIQLKNFTVDVVDEEDFTISTDMSSFGNDDAIDATAFAFETLENSLLHAHPLLKEADENHVIVDKKDWKKVRKLLKLLKGIV